MAKKEQRTKAELTKALTNALDTIEQALETNEDQRRTMQLLLSEKDALHSAWTALDEKNKEYSRILRTVLVSLETMSTWIMVPAHLKAIKGLTLYVEGAPIEELLEEFVQMEVTP